MDQDAVATLSKKQLACLRLVAKLKNTEDIAFELGIAPSTVNTHIERAVIKLRTANRFKAAERVIAWDLAHSTSEADDGAPDPAPAAASHRAVNENSEPSLATPAQQTHGTQATQGGEKPAVLQTATACPENSPTENQRLFDPAVSPPNHLASTIATGRRRNDLTIPQRLLAGLMALVLLCLAIAGLGAAIEQLSHWRTSLAARR